MSTYTSVTDQDLRAMLETIGVSSVQELFDRQIPASVRLGRPLELPAGMAEQDVYTHLRELAARNVSAEDEISFLGAGMYDHYVPAVIDMLMERSEFLTPYTPYQPEVSQGNLQVMFEYQTAISELTALPVSNASVYEGPSALASAGYLARLANGRPRFVASAGLHPHALETLRTYAAGFGAEVVEVPLRDGVTDPDAWAAAMSDDVGAIFLQQPNVLGAVEDVAALTAVKPEGSVAIAAYDPIPLGILVPPGECGVDVCVGEGQTLGNRLDFGGPSFGFFAATEEHLRRMPGRIAGETVDTDGRRGFVLTLQTREQHIRREKATSNICTAQALNALAGVVYLSWLGRQGIVELGELLLQRTHYARETLGAIDGVEPLHAQPVVREFALRLELGEHGTVEGVVDRCVAAGVNPGLPLERLGIDEPGLLVAITERRSRADIDRLAAVLADAVAAESSAGAAREVVGA
ncbi:MAG TPA: aminomethyl-transferring glycine dehydrogenase subunit GcvPA [Solirubrobacteraceae bacterium]|nr:aminomethyl-transferring glycine dehydrogenase subunit GcvPA [Solirubrobacteraceae bacterium]